MTESELGARGKERDFSQMKVQEVIKLLSSDVNIGLKSSQVESRVKLYGYNEVIEKKTSPLVRFAKKFWGLTPLMLEVIIILSWILQKYADVYIVTGLLFLNSGLGFVEEQRASNAVETLKKKLQVNARVLRDGVWKTIPARELVPGDIVRTRSGDFVPADVKILTGNLEVDQSALTGESLAAEKNTNDLLYSGSIARRGESSGIVVATGTKTYFGRTAQLVQLARPKLHIEQVVSSVVRWLLIIVTILIVIFAGFSIIRAFKIKDILPMVLILLLSAIPVALPAMFTISMAIGSMKLARKGVLVTRLSASEDASTMDVLCTDKTGTITMNKLSIANILPLGSFTENDVILYGALASQEANQDPIDLAFIGSAKQRKLMDNSYVQENFLPFDPTKRRTEALVQKNNQSYRVMKGAVNVIAKECGLDDGATKKLEIRMQEFAAKGYRTLAVAKADGKNQPQMVGLVTLYDAPRPDSKQLIEELKDLGISIKMLTGDALPIAKEIAKSVGLGENVIKVSDLKEFIKGDSIKAVETAEKSAVFAEIYPEDKYTIVKTLQAKKHIVGMTGDGVNDAPALRQAEVGIAVSTATDVAKGAASVVLTNEGLISIVDLIQNGRAIYERITAWILSKIVRTLQIAIFVVLSFLLTTNYAISTFAIILYFFMTDFVKISLSTDNVRWSKKPDTWDITSLVKASIVLCLLVVIESFGLLYVVFSFFHVGPSDAKLYTFTFEILFYSAMFLIFNIRERGHFWDSRPSRILMAAIILSTFVATLISTVGIPGLAPVPLTETLVVMACSLAFSLIPNDLIKLVYIRKTGAKW